VLQKYPSKLSSNSNIDTIFFSFIKTTGLFVKQNNEAEVISNADFYFKVRCCSSKFWFNMGNCWMFCFHLLWQKWPVWEQHSRPGHPPGFIILPLSLGICSNKILAMLKYFPLTRKTKWKKSIMLKLYLSLSLAYMFISLCAQTKYEKFKCFPSCPLLEQLPVDFLPVQKMCIPYSAPSCGFMWQVSLTPLLC